MSIIYKKHYDMLFDFVCIYIIEKVRNFGRDDLNFTNGISFDLNFDSYL